MAAPDDHPVRVHTAVGSSRPRPARTGAVTSGWPSGRRRARGWGREPDGGGRARRPPQTRSRLPSTPPRPATAGRQRGESPPVVRLGVVRDAEEPPSASVPPRRAARGRPRRRSRSARRAGEGGSAATYRSPGCRRRLARVAAGQGFRSRDCRRLRARRARGRSRLRSAAVRERGASGRALGGRRDRVVRRALGGGISAAATAPAEELAAGPDDDAPGHPGARRQPAPAVRRRVERLPVARADDEHLLARPDAQQRPSESPLGPWNGASRRQVRVAGV